jgi:hypothetical protein
MAPVAKIRLFVLCILTFSFCAKLALDQPRTLRTYLPPNRGTTLKGTGHSLLASNLPFGLVKNKTKTQKMGTVKTSILKFKITTANIHLSVSTSTALTE